MQKNLSLDHDFGTDVWGWPYISHKHIRCKYRKVGVRLRKSGISETKLIPGPHADAQPVVSGRPLWVGLVADFPRNMRVTMARKPVKLPDYFTTEEASALADMAPSYPVKMAMMVMLRTGL